MLFRRFNCVTGQVKRFARLLSLLLLRLSNARFIKERRVLSKFATIWLIVILSKVISKKVWLLWMRNIQILSKRSFRSLILAQYTFIKVGIGFSEIFKELLLTLFQHLFLFLEYLISKLGSIFSLWLQESLDIIFQKLVLRPQLSRSSGAVWALVVFGTPTWLGA